MKNIVTLCVLLISIFGDQLNASEFRMMMAAINSPPLCIYTSRFPPVTYGPIPYLPDCDPGAVLLNNSCSTSGPSMCDLNEDLLREILMHPNPLDEVFDKKKGARDRLALTAELFKDGRISPQNVRHIAWKIALDQRTELTLWQSLKRLVFPDPESDKTLINYHKTCLTAYILAFKAAQQHTDLSSRRQELYLECDRSLILEQISHLVKLGWVSENIKIKPIMRRIKKSFTEERVFYRNDTDKLIKKWNFVGDM